MQFMKIKRCQNGNNTVKNIYVRRDMEQKYLNKYKRKLKKIRKNLKLAGGHRLYAEAAALIGEKLPFAVSFLDGEPLIMSAVRKNRRFDTAGVVRALITYSGELTNADMETMMWQIRCAALLEAADNPQQSGLVYKTADIDAEYINSYINPLCIKYSADEWYMKSDEKTRAFFRNATTQMAQELGKRESSLSSEFMNRARVEGVSVCEIIASEHRRLHPYRSPLAYAAWIALPAFALSTAAYFAYGYAGGFLFYPIAGIAKTALDTFLMRRADSRPVPASELSLAESHSAVCVLSALICSERDIADAAERLHRARIKNDSGNIKYCLLCDLPPSDEAESEKDSLLIGAAKNYCGECAVIFRYRTFSETQKKYQGRERKRGAIEDIIRFIMGENVDFRASFGDTESLRGAEFIAALDYDTSPLMDSINSLIAAAIHPCNKDYGIFAPRITTSLPSSIKTQLTRLFGTGGCSGASVYDNSAAELYNDCFGEGTFTGKGLIRTERYYRECVGALPDERVLSHDILEGGLLGTAYCGDVEFNDSMPFTTKGFFRRQHRWLRGDLQNGRFILDRRFSFLTKIKLADNMRRACAPSAVIAVLFLSLFCDSSVPAAIALLSVVFPYLIGLIPAALKGLGFSNTREFYAPIFSLSRLLLSQLFFEIIFIGRNAVLSFDAQIRTAWRMLTGRKLLEWQTASALDGAVGYSEMLLPCLSGLLLFFGAVLFGKLFIAVTALFIISCLPAAVICDRATPDTPHRIRESDKKRLIDEARREWAFYEDYVTAEDNFLPPDNVQYSPVYRVSHRTSPTNIGMYLLSCICAHQLRFIDKERFFCLVGRTIETAARLPKYCGNLYNWYSTEDLSALGSFVSSVDSGNFLCCLVALRQELKNCGADEELIRRVSELIDSADISVFYNKPRRLFSVGIDAKTGKRMPNCYDMLMSEARMLSYFAIARKNADIRHWHALSRIMSRSGHYAGPVAWTGTMFEYFMPELLLHSGRGSLCGEALGYAVYCQKERARHRKLPFGISESGYYAFDSELNYQYKAHGVQRLALCAGMDSDYVVSPYSSFLALSDRFNDCMKNLSRISEPEYRHEKYGFYEAIDLSPRRTGSSCGVVKSHMAHHVGMSMGGITNALCGSHLQRLFMSDETMQRADELLEERVMAGEIVLDIERIREKNLDRISGEEYDRFDIMRPVFNIVANRRLALFVSDTGLYYGRYGQRLTAVPSPDYLRRPRGAFFGFCADGETVPFYVNMYDTSRGIKRSVVFSENSAEYHAEKDGVSYGMKLSLFGENAAELREIAAENHSAAAKEISFYACIEPLLLKERDYTAHPAFADLFIKPEYDGGKRLVIVRRKDRYGECFMALGFVSGADFIYSFGRENVFEYNSPCDFKKALEITESDSRSIPAPCVFVRRDMKLSAGSRFSDSLFICCGRSRSEVLGLADSVRASAEDEPVSPLPKSALGGQLARRVLPALLCHSTPSPERKESALKTDTLWRFGISGDFPIILMRSGSVLRDCKDGALSMMNGLESCGLSADLVIFCRTADEKNRFESFSFGRKCVFPLLTSELTAAEQDFFLSAAACVLGEEAVSSAPDRIMEIVPCEVGASDIPDGFSGDSYAVPKKGHPQSHIIASAEFGCVLSQNSLGFSYAMNSRENKLTPWYNDLLHDNDGEMLLIKGSGRYFDIISGAKAVFSPALAEYYGAVGRLDAKTEVRVFEKGMGKQLRVILTNNSAAERQCAVSYYTEPVLGADRNSCGYGAFLSYRKSGNALIVRNDRNMSFCGEMAVSCSLPCVMTADREGFFAGKTDGGIIPSAHSCAAVTAKVKLPPHKSAEVTFTLAYSRGDVTKMLAALGNSGFVQPVSGGEIKSGSDTLDRLYRAWLPWQVAACRMRARSGFYQNGGAFGFRDQLQDAAAASYFSPTEAKRQILRCCASQFADGDVLHWWHRTNSGRKGVRTRCSDDMLWLPYASAMYAERTGDNGIFGIPVHYVSGEPLGTDSERYIEVSQSAEKDSVFGHCRRAFECCLKKGAHGLILMGSGDWNDGYNRVGGESVWLSMFYVMTVKAFAPAARRIGETAFADRLEKQAAELSADIEKNAFADGQYLRAFYADGSEMGAEGAECCAVDLLPQAFAELAALPDGEKRRSALIAAAESLTDSKSRLIKLFSPPFSEGKRYPETGYVTDYPEGVRENGAQYTHAAVWYALALLHSGDRKDAEKYASWLSPAERGENFMNEPYYMTADIYTNAECRGRGGWSLYTGAAGWYYTLLRELYGKEQ